MNNLDKIYDAILGSRPRPIKVQTRVRKLRSKWTVERIDEFEILRGIDVTEELSRLLTEELEKIRSSK